MEKLYAYAYLWALDFVTEQQYNDYLDRLFLESPYNELLAELELCSGSYNKSFGVLYGYFLRTNAKFDINTFGKILFAEMKKIYTDNRFTIETFIDKCCWLYRNLPDIIDVFDCPFFYLGHIDDIYDYCGEADARKQIEQMLDFFEES
ncbi:MAG: hypothetical protein K2N27_05845 [Ruminococcus sp.]|nr:hypothetical protein [Ruminococcus sp.]